MARAELERAARSPSSLALDDAGFRALFAGSPVKRIGRDRFVRNVLIAIGNSGELALAEAAVALLDDASPLVRGMAVWAIAQLLPPSRVGRLRSDGKSASRMRMSGTNGGAPHRSGTFPS